MLTVAVINQKGGVGKTTTTVNLGAGLARLGRRVLLVDLDPQANLTSHLEPQRREEDGGAYELLRGLKPLADVVRPTKVENLAVVPADEGLAGCEVELAGEIGRETLLRDRLERARSDGLDYDFVFLDCPPSLGLISVNALSAADEALIPIQAEFFALSGMARFVEVQGVVRERLNPRLELGGILICMWRGSARLSHEVRDEVRRVFGEALFETVVRQNVKLAEAPSAAQTIFDYAPDSNGAADYAALVVEFLERHDRAAPAGAVARLLAGAARSRDERTDAPSVAPVSRSGATPPAGSGEDGDEKGPKDEAPAADVGENSVEGAADARIVGGNEGG